MHDSSRSVEGLSISHVRLPKRNALCVYCVAKSILIDNTGMSFGLLKILLLLLISNSNNFIVYLEVYLEKKTQALFLAEKNNFVTRFFNMIDLYI